jgi:ketosteroid isomerase-like protein
MPQENVEIVRRSLAAYPHDQEAAFAGTHSNLEWVVAKEHPNSRTLHGREEIVRYQGEWEEMLGEIQFDMTDYRDAGERVVAIGSVRGTGTGSGIPVEVPLALVYLFEGDKIARIEEYLDPNDALEAAGLSE